MRNLYRAVPRPGTGKRPLYGKGSKAWETRARNNESDDGSGWVFVVTGLGGLACDRIHVGQTRNHPSFSAITLHKANLVTHWAHYREIEAHHRLVPRQLWAVPVPDRRAAKLRMSQMLIEEGVTDPNLAAVLRVMGAVTGIEPARFSLIPPTDNDTIVATMTC